MLPRLHGRQQLHLSRYVSAHKIQILFFQVRTKVLKAIFVWSWNENARTKQNGNRAISLVYRTDKSARDFDWWSENFNFKKSIDTSLWRHTATRLANRTMPSPYKGFLWWENEESMFWSFHPLADKTNKEHLPKPFFKVLRKLLYLMSRTCYSYHLTDKAKADFA